MLVKSRPVGVTIVGAQAGELIGLWALALQAGLKLGSIAAMIAPYPTLGEISKRAAGAYYTPKLFDNPWVKRAVRLVQRQVGVGTPAMRSCFRKKARARATSCLSLGWSTVS